MKKKKERKRMGRPFVGEVKNAFGLENNVLEKRSIFRAHKKFYGKGKYLKNKMV